MLETAADHWPFSNNFYVHLADQSPFWSAKFTNDAWMINASELLALHLIYRIHTVYA